MAASTSTGEAAGAPMCRRQRPPVGAARGDAVLPRRADPGRDRRPARGVAADGGPTHRPGQGQRPGSHRGRGPAQHERRSARRRGARTREALRADRSGRRRPRRRRRCAGAARRVRQRRSGRGRPADAAPARPTTCSGSPGVPNRSRWPTPSCRGWRVAARWSSSTAPCRRRRIRPVSSTS